MAKKDKEASSFAQQEEKEAKKKLKSAEKQQKPEKGKETKEKQPGKKKSKRFGRWFRDFRGETKKITWPDAKAVMKGTGMVILMVIIVGTMVWIIDFGLSTGIRELRQAAAGFTQEAEVDQPDDDNGIDFEEDFQPPVTGEDADDDAEDEDEEELEDEDNDDE